MFFRRYRYRRESTESGSLVYIKTSHNVTLYHSTCLNFISVVTEQTLKFVMKYCRESIQHNRSSEKSLERTAAMRRRQTKQQLEQHAFLESAQVWSYKVIRLRHMYMLCNHTRIHAPPNLPRHNVFQHCMWSTICVGEISYQISKARQKFLRQKVGGNSCNSQSIGVFVEGHLRLEAIVSRCSERGNLKHYSRE